MSRIKYLVTGIDNAVLGSIIGTLARGELEGPADIVVVPQPTPKAYIINANGLVKDIGFEQFLTATVAAERKKIIERSTGEALIREVVEKMAN